MLTEKIMHTCIRHLIRSLTDPELEDLEALCKLLTTIGERIDRPEAGTHMEAYFSRMHTLAENQQLPARIRFLVKDVIDLRRSKWMPRRQKVLLPLLSMCVS
jgi:translation initiation factor 4G